MTANLYLASTSPRRKVLLSQLGLDFQVIAADVAEDYLTPESFEDYVKRVALAKARQGQVSCCSEAVILAADTAIVHRDQLLTKPEDQAHAAQMLASLSNQSHWVYSAVACVCGQRQVVCLVKSRVTFRSITACEITAYWQTKEPWDKAGGYAIQGRGAVFIRHLEGSYSGVMGLPLFETGQLLQQFGVQILGGVSE